MEQSNEAFIAWINERHELLKKRYEDNEMITAEYLMRHQMHRFFKPVAGGVAEEYKKIAIQFSNYVNLVNETINETGSNISLRDTDRAFIENECFDVYLSEYIAYNVQYAISSYQQDYDGSLVLSTMFREELELNNKLSKGTISEKKYRKKFLMTKMFQYQCLTKGSLRSRRKVWDAKYFLCMSNAMIGVTSINSPGQFHTDSGKKYRAKAYDSGFVMKLTMTVYVGGFLALASIVSACYFLLF